MATPLTGQVDFEVHGKVAHLILNRPEKINAMTVTMDEQMNSYIYEINNNLEIRSVLLYGKGEKGFCAGSDLTDLGEYGSNWEYRNRFDRNLDYARAIWLIKKPVVASLHGWVIGGGLEMACASDICVASPDAKFLAGEIRWGWHGGSGQTQLLSHRVGPGNASLFLLRTCLGSGCTSHGLGPRVGIQRRSAKSRHCYCRIYRRESSHCSSND